MQQSGQHPVDRKTISIISLLSLFAFLVQGFHPYAEDGGLYVAGIKKVLDPSLYRTRPEFVLAPMRFSPFALVVADIARIFHLSLPWLLLLLYVSSIWATLFGGWMVISRCSASLAARCGAVGLLACWLGIPIAGTSLMLMDPYLTARSFSTPLTLFAIAWAMDARAGGRRAWILCALALTLATVHPLMAGFAFGAVGLALVADSKRTNIRRWGPVGLGACALGIAAILQAIAAHESAQYLAAAMTRTYWFPLQWQWYEWFGLLAPIALLFALGHAAQSSGGRTLSQMAITLGTISLVVALVFSRTELATHLVARLQPLRSFQIVYEVMILLLGAWLAEHWLGKKAWRWGLLMIMLGGIMFGAQRSTYPASAHVEWPGMATKNQWAQAFRWIREHTPKDALFALDAHYITREGEDAQSFRGIAERSVLADYSKDGGETSIAPSLAEAWAEGQTAQTRLDEESDSERIAALKPARVGWVVLAKDSVTAWECPYENASVKVCRIP